MLDVFWRNPRSRAIMRDFPHGSVCNQVVKEMYYNFYKKLGNSPVLIA